MFCCEFEIILQIQTKNMKYGTITYRPDFQTFLRPCPVLYICGLLLSNLLNNQYNIYLFSVFGRVIRRCDRCQIPLNGVRVISPALLKVAAVLKPAFCITICARHHQLAFYPNGAIATTETLLQQRLFTPGGHVRPNTPRILQCPCRWSNLLSIFKSMEL